MDHGNLNFDIDDLINSFDKLFYFYLFIIL